jgi:hypothetical protein
LVTVHAKVSIDFSETVMVPSSVPVKASVRGFQVSRVRLPATS